MWKLAKDGAARANMWATSLVPNEPNYEFKGYKIINKESTTLIYDGTKIRIHDPPPIDIVCNWFRIHLKIHVL